MKLPLAIMALTLAACSGMGLGISLGNPVTQTVIQGDTTVEVDTCDGTYSLILEDSAGNWSANLSGGGNFTLSSTSTTGLFFVDGCTTTPTNVVSNNMAGSPSNIIYFSYKDATVGTAVLTSTYQGTGVSNATLTAKVVK